MSNIEFGWDIRKANANLKKHGVSFDEARSVFYDENARRISDPEHSHEAERFILLGMSANHSNHFRAVRYRTRTEVL